MFFFYYKCIFCFTCVSLDLQSLMAGDFRFHMCVFGFFTCAFWISDVCFKFSHVFWMIHMCFGGFRT